MSLELCVLASGSAGNSTVLRSPRGAMLIDIGIGPRTAARRLDGTGVGLHEIRAVCLTHLDRDHFNTSWLNTLLKLGIRVFCHATRGEDVLSIAAQSWPQAKRDQCVAALTELLCPFEHDPFEPLPGLHFRPIPLPHDQAGSHGFVIAGHGCRIGYATDLGAVTQELLDHFDDLDVLALESNYDPQMQRQSGRPFFLQQRIMGGFGHLSNGQALDAVRHILDRCQRTGRALPAHIVLLHRSEECNCPRLLRRLFTQDQRIEPRLTLADQHQRTTWLAARRTARFTGEQLTLAWEDK